MKQDPFFKYLAATLIAGVLLAVFNPTDAADQPPPPDAIVASVHNVQPVKT